MSKPFTEEDFSSQIDEDRTWRIREISDLKTAVKSSDDISRKVLLRALIAICYAHWEGHVRFSAKKYLEHIALRKFAYSELDRQFFRNYFLPRLASLSISKTSIKQRCDLVDEILNSSSNRFSHVNEDLVNTKSNLNFEVLSDICLICNIPIRPFQDKSTFIDVILLKRRNSVAHGEETLIGFEELDNLADDTISIMRNFSDALENRVYQHDYKVA